MPLSHLPLVAFEHYMLADDRPDYPMTFFFRLRFTGRFDRPLFFTALHATLGLHPLLHAWVRGFPKQATSHLYWIDADAQPPSISWEGEERPIVLDPSESIDLRQESGIRLWVREGWKATDLFFQCHHSCCDALGALHFLETLLELYASARTGAPEPVMGRELDPALIFGRGRSVVTWLEHLRRTPKDLVRITNFFRITPQALAPSRDPSECGTVPTVLPGFCSTILGENDSCSIIEVAKRKNVTVNDLLLRDLFLTLNRWNRSRSPGGSDGPLRIAMPINLRNPPGAFMPAMNAVSMVFLDRTPDQLADPRELLGSLRTETDDIKRWQMGLTFHRVLTAAGRLPGGMMALVGTRRPASTAVLSNLGVPFTNSPLLMSDYRLAVADAVLDGIEFFPPIRPLTRAALGVLSYGMQLSLGLRYDPHLISEREGCALLEMMAGQVESTARNSTL